MENDMQNDTTERSATAKKSLLDGWNAPPNLVTYSRIVLVVIFLGLYIAAGSWGENNIPMRWAAAVLFIVAASTDKVDGWMARKYNQVTELGKLMDPIADKLLTCATLIVAAVFGELGPVWLGWIIVALFLLREVGITVMRFFVIDTGGKVIAANMWGKVKTVLQMLTIIFYYFTVSLTGNVLGQQCADIASVLCWVVAAVTAISGIKYLWDNRSFINTAK